MSLPREGSREIDEGIIVSEAMDWCKSPTAPVPYRIWAKQVQATDLANSVRQTDDRSHVRDSLVLASYGDEPGVGGGVVSGTRGAECTPKTWSETVRAEGRNMVRHDDLWWMNHKNTYGRLSYAKDQAQYPTRDPEAVDPKMQVAFYQAPGTATDAPTPGATARAPTPEGSPDTTTPGWGDVIWGMGKKAITSPMGKFGPAVGAFLTVMTPTPLNKDEDVRISKVRRDQECCIAPYSINSPYNPAKPERGGANGCARCKKGQKTAAHHGMVDYPFRTGGAWDSKSRAPGAPSYSAALTICVPTGDPDDSDATDEHGELHKNFEISMNSANDNGLVTFGQVKANSFQEIDRLSNETLSPECKALYKQELTQQYKLLDGEQLRGRQSPSPESDSDPTTFNTLQQAWRPH